MLGLGRSQERAMDAQGADPERLCDGIATLPLIMHSLCLRDRYRGQRVDLYGLQFAAVSPHALVPTISTMHEDWP